MKQKKSIISRTVYEFPFFKDRLNIFPLFFTRALLACLICGFGSVTASLFLQMPIENLYLFLFSSGICFLFFVLFSFFRKGFVVLSVLAVSALLIFLYRKTLADNYKYFWEQLMTVCNGRFLETSEFTFGLEWNSVKHEHACFLMMYIISAFMAFVTAISSIHRFYPENIIIVEVIFLAPAFISESASYYPELGLFIASIAALCAVNTAYLSEEYLVTGSWRNAKKRFFGAERTYTKSNRKLSGFKKLRTDLRFFNRYSSSAVSLFVAFALVVTLVSSIFPKNGSIDITEFINSINRITTQASDVVFGTLINSEGYFSADTQNSEINISNSINSPMNSERGNSEALRVTLSTLSASVKTPIYLRGDIGYAYGNEKWDSIAGLDYDNYVFGGNSMEQILGTYSTDIEYLLFRQRAAFTGTDPETLFPAVNVKIDYTKKSNTVFMPLAPYELTFRGNAEFDCTGDFVTAARNVFSRISSFESLTIYPVVSGGNYENFGKLLFDYYSNYGNDMNLSFPDGINYETYEQNKTAYRAFVDTVYTRVPKSESENIVKLILNNYTIGGIVLDSGNKAADYAASMYGYTSDELSRLTNEYKQLILASELTRYLASGADYSYSLGAGNHSGENTYLGNFLFDTHKGHCALYATTLTLLLRYYGIPSRYVTGYVVNGRYQSKTDEGFVYSIKEKQLHAWVEVYFDDIGWLPFDPTPGIDETDVDTTEKTTEATTAVTTAKTTPAETTVSSDSENTTAPHTESTAATNSDNSNKSENNVLVTVLLYAVAIIAALALIFAVYNRIRAFLKSVDQKESELFKSFSEDEAAAACALMLRFTLRLLKLCGITRQNGETPLDFAARSEKLRPVKNIAFTEVMEIFERAEFAVRENVFISEDERRMCYLYVNRLTKKFLYEELQMPKRLLYRIKLFRFKSL